MTAPWCIIQLTLIIFMMLFVSPVRSGAVQHHGNDVDAAGSHEDCMSCHDGISAKNISICTDNCFAHEPHPVNKRYPPLGKSHLYAPISLLKEQGMQFTARKITCISCHNLRNEQRYHLVLETEHAKLCLACHVRM